MTPISYGDAHSPCDAGSASTPVPVIASEIKPNTAATMPRRTSTPCPIQAGRRQVGPGLCADSGRESRSCLLQPAIHMLCTLAEVDGVKRIPLDSPLRHGGPLGPVISMADPGPRGR